MQIFIWIIKINRSLYYFTRFSKKVSRAVEIYAENRIGCYAIIEGFVGHLLVNRWQAVCENELPHDNVLVQNQRPVDVLPGSYRPQNAADPVRISGAMVYDNHIVRLETGECWQNINNHVRRILSVTAFLEENYLHACKSVPVCKFDYLKRVITRIVQTAMIAMINFILRSLMFRRCSKR